MNSLIIILLGGVITYIGLYFVLSYLPYAEVNKRSAHYVATPQGAGLVIFMALMICFFTPLTGIAFALSIVGFMDDKQGLGVKTRLLAHGIAAALALYIIAPIFPFWMLPLFWIGLVWNINLTNFMDGMDGISILQGLTISIGIMIAGTMGYVSQALIWLAAGVIGCLIGFLPFNKPKAKAFMGDAGSLPLGLITGVLLIGYAERAGLIPALILTLYYASDSGITLLLRLKRGDKLSEGHKSHFYQQAMQKGMEIYSILGWITLANLGLIGLSLGAIQSPIACLILAIVIIIILLFSFSHQVGKLSK